jgi:hypothetical protein
MQTITKVYETHIKARSAVHDLEAAGIPKAAISILANQDVSETYGIGNEKGTEAVAGAGLGAVVGGAAGLITGLGMMTVPGLGPVVAAGWLATTSLGAAVGGVTGGIVGSLIDAGVPEDHAHIYSEAVRRGGTLLSVQWHFPLISSTLRQTGSRTEAFRELATSLWTYPNLTVGPLSLSSSTKPN